MLMKIASLQKNENYNAKQIKSKQNESVTKRNKTKLLRPLLQSYLY